MKAYTLGQLAWVRTIGCFAGDARSVMTELGVSVYNSMVLTGAEAFRRGDLVALYHDCCHDVDVTADLELYIDHCLKSYPPGWPQ